MVAAVTGFICPTDEVTSSLLLLHHDSAYCDEGQENRQHYEHGVDAACRRLLVAAAESHLFLLLHDLLDLRA